MSRQKITTARIASLLCFVIHAIKIEKTIGDQLKHANKIVEEKKRIISKTFLKRLVGTWFAFGFA